MSARASGDPISYYAPIRNKLLKWGELAVRGGQAQFDLGLWVLYNRVEERNARVVTTGSRGGDVELSPCTLDFRRGPIGCPKVWGRHLACHGVRVEFGLTATAVVSFAEWGDLGSEARYEIGGNGPARCQPHDRSM